MRLALASLIAAAALVQAPAVADPAIKVSMPAIQASLLNGDLVVRMQRNLLGSAHNMTPRTMVVVGRDAGGNIVFESETPVTNRMTYARVAATPALQSAAALAVSLR